MQLLECAYLTLVFLLVDPTWRAVGGNVVSSFASIQPWQSEGFVEPIFKSSTAGKCLAICWVHIGYGATLLNRS